MVRYRSKPQEVDAVQWTGENWPEVMAFGGPDGKVASTVWNFDPGALNGTRALSFEVFAGEPLQLKAGKDGAQEWVPVPVGHWLVHAPGDLSDIWPVDPEYFAAKYDAIE